MLHHDFLVGLSCHATVEVSGTVTHLIRNDFDWISRSSIIKKNEVLNERTETEEEKEGDLNKKKKKKEEVKKQ